MAFWAWEEWRIGVLGNLLVADRFLAEHRLACLELLVGEALWAWLESLAFAGQCPEAVLAYWAWSASAGVLVA